MKNKWKTLRVLLIVVVAVVTACTPNPARIDFVKQQAYNLGAKLGDSPTTRLAERFEPTRVRSRLKMGAQPRSHITRAIRAPFKSSAPPTPTTIAI